MPNTLNNILVIKNMFQNFEDIYFNLNLNLTLTQSNEIIEGILSNYFVFQKGRKSTINQESRRNRMRQIKSEQKKTSSQKYSRISDYEMENQNYLFKKIKLNNKPRVRKISEETEDQYQTWKGGMMSEIISSKRKIKKDR